jgi:hypothetical protein
MLTAQNDGVMRTGGGLTVVTDEPAARGCAGQSPAIPRSATAASMARWKVGQV